MEVVIFVLVLLGILVSIAGGVWVAIALVSAISTRQNMTTQQHHANGKTHGFSV
jgi:hypothetical protein